MLNKLTLNVKKSNFIIFKSHKRKLKNSFESKIKQWVATVRWTHQISRNHYWSTPDMEKPYLFSYGTKKITRITGVLCRIGFYISQPLLRMLYYSLIYPQLHYWNIIWANTYPTRLEKLLKLQKIILRTITVSSYTAPSLPLFNKLDILNIHQINDLLISSFSFSLTNNILPPYFDDFCIENFKVHI